MSKLSSRDGQAKQKNAPEVTHPFIMRDELTVQDKSILIKENAVIKTVYSSQFLRVFIELNITAR